MTVRNLEQGRGTVAPLISILATLEQRFDHQPPDLGLGGWLREVRRGMRFSQERLSLIAGISKPSVIQIERDRGHVQTLVAVMRALDLQVALAPFEQVSGSPGSVHVQVQVGDCREVLPRMPAKRVHTCVTSPPYFQQRDYAADGQIGMEASPDEYVANLVALFREVRRVLRDDGTLWLVLGDAFARNSAHARRRKELLGLPWRAAFALQDDGWFLRQDIILNKMNGLPEPVKDRLVRAHEYLFLFTKGQRYHFNAAALRERGVSINPGTRQRDTRETHGSVSGGNGGLNAAKERMRLEIEEHGYVTRHKRSVWPFSSQPTRSGHFGTFPEALVEPCILAGCPEGGVVLDPFGGSGTTGVVARRLGRSAVLIELNPNYAESGRRRCAAGAVKPALRQRKTHPDAPDVRITEGRA